MLSEAFCVTFILPYVIPDTGWIKCKNLLIMPIHILVLLVRITHTHLLPPHVMGNFLHEFYPTYTIYTI